MKWGVLKLQAVALDEPIEGALKVAAMALWDSSSAVDWQVPEKCGGDVRVGGWGVDDSGGHDFCP
jgi:hypothetical protein